MGSPPGEALPYRRVSRPTASRRGRGSRQSRTDATGCGHPQLDAQVVADALSRDESTHGGGVEQAHLPKVKADGIQAAAVEKCGKRSPQRPCGHSVESAANGYHDLTGTDMIDPDLESSTAPRRAPPVRRRGLRFRHRASLRYPYHYTLLTGRTRRGVAP